MGTFQFEITGNGKPIVGSPYQFEVTPTLDPSKTTAFGPGLKEAVKGVPAKFSISLQDSFGNPVPGKSSSFMVKFEDKVVHHIVVENGRKIR